MPLKSMGQRWVLSGIVLGSALLGGCGGGGNEAAPAGESAPTSGAGAGSDPVPGSMLATSLQGSSALQAEAAPSGLASGGGFESIQSLTIDANDAGYARPKVAALDYDFADSSATKQALLARFGFVIIGARTGTTLQQLAAGIRARKSNIPLAIYTVPTETYCNPPSSGDTYNSAIWQAVQNTDWWLHQADGSKSAWSSTWGTCDVNYTAWGKRDASGRTWPQWRYQYDKAQLIDHVPNAWWFSDNGWASPRVSADYKRIGTNQAKTDPTIVSAIRSGMTAYWDLLHAGGANAVMSNVDSDLDFAPYQGKLRGAFYEGAMGRSWSIETWATWNDTMNRYRALMRNTYGHLALFQVYGGVTDYAMMRYGLASSLMEDGMYVYVPSTGTFKPTWYDEYDAPIGAPSEPPPTAPAQNGIWMRRYANGVVLVNPSKTASASIDVGSGYKRLLGSQDPAVNNGAVQSRVTLGPRQGLLMVRN